MVSVFSCPGSSIPDLGHSVTGCHFRILTQRVTFETWDNNNNNKDNDNDNNDNDNNIKDNDNKDNDNKDNYNKDNNNDHDHDEYRGPNCDFRAVSQFCDVFDFVDNLCPTLHLLLVHKKHKAGCTVQYGGSSVTWWLDKYMLDSITAFRF